MKKQQSGFTLIELIMVIVVLGILAAFALPKFVNLSGDARVAVLQGAFASLKSTSAMVHSSYLAKNDATLTRVGIEGGTYVAVVNGYPAAKDAAAAAPIPAGVGVADAAGLTSADFTIDVATAGTAIVRPKGVAAPASGDPEVCAITYTEAAAGGVPSIAIATSDCNN